MGKKPAPEVIESPEPRSQVPFGLRDESYTLQKPTLNHRIWKHMQGKEEVRDQVLDLTGNMILNSHTAKEMPHFVAIFQPHSPEEQAKEEGQEELKGMESPKKYIARRFGKLTLGKEYGYHSNEHAIIMDDVYGQDDNGDAMVIDPQQGITLNYVHHYSDEAGNDKILANVTFKHIPWSDQFLNCMDYEIELSFAANARPLQTDIKEVPEEDEGEE